MKKNKLLIAFTVLIFALIVCSSTSAGTGTKDDPVSMVVTGEFTRAKMTEVLAEINGAKKYVSLDLSPMTCDVFDLEFLQRNGQEYVVSLKLPGATTSIVGSGSGLYLDRFSGLASVTIPKGVTSIWVGAFSGCTSLTAINVDVANPAYSSQDGVLYNKGKTGLHTYPLGKAVSSFAIPNGVICIGEAAFFYCTDLASVTIPNSVTTIERWAFTDCHSLTNITIPNSVTTIGEWAFSETSLTSVAIPNSVTAIGQNAFGCNSLTAINVDAVNTAYSSQDGVLYSKDKTVIQTYPPGKASSSFAIPNSVTAIGRWAFTSCSGLTSVTIPNSVTAIGDGAFDNCTGLTNVTIPNSVTAIGREAFNKCSGLTNVTIPDGVTTIEVGTFQMCRSLTRVTIPDSVTAIGDWAFNLCTGLKSVTMPNSVTAIGRYAFQACNGLTSVTFEGTIPSNGFSNSFMGDLRAKFYATNPANGTPGTYKTTMPVGSSSVWTKQP